MEAGRARGGWARARLGRAHAPPPSLPPADPADVERRIQEAAAQATAVAEDGVNDLLVCLGQVRERRGVGGKE